MAMDDTGDIADYHGNSEWAQLARKHWLQKPKPVTRVQQEVVKNQIWDPLEKDNFSSSSLQLLESLQTIENYLWPGFNEDASNQHVLLIALLLNVKRAGNLPTWSLFDRPADFSILFRRFLALSLDVNLHIKIRVNLILTLVGAFQSLDNGLVRKECAPLVSIGIWENLHSEVVRNRLLEENGQFKKAWRAAKKRFDAADDTAKIRMRFDRAWLYTLVLDFFDILYDETRHSLDSLIYCERLMELLTDLQSQFPTRRYVNTLLQDFNILVVVERSSLYRDSSSALLRDFHILLRHYTHFPINDHTGQQLTRQEVAQTQARRISRLQRIALKHFKDKLTLLALSHQGALEKRDELESHLEALNDSEVQSLMQHLGCRTKYPDSSKIICDKKFSVDVILSMHEKRSGYREAIQNMPLLPTEQSLYESSFLRNENYNGERPLALPKLNLQYLTTGDFFWRSFVLFRCEQFYEIRKNMEEVAKRLQPRRDNSTGQTRFGGSTRMALQIPKPAIVDIAPAKVGEEVPSQVTAEVTIDVSRMNRNALAEWESLRPEDVVFLMTLNAVERARMLTNGDAEAAEQRPFQYLRAAEVINILDENGRPIRNQTDQSNGYHRRSRQRRLMLKLDVSAYQDDMARVKEGKPNIYETINVLIRRRSRENNFKPMLESIQRLTMMDMPLPNWLSDVFLGLGDPSGATYKHMPNALHSIDFRDTFLNWKHLLDALPDETVESSEANEISNPPFVLQKVQQQSQTNQIESSKRRRHAGNRASQSNPSKPPVTDGGERHADETPQTSSRTSKKRRRDEVDEGSTSDVVQVSTYAPQNMGPYPTDEPKLNSVRFTPAQVEAIRSGTQPGLTVIVGPPGTGKTDVATQIINNIYHNFPTERTLLVAHSNQALNQLFQKIVALDIDERHLLRLGHGEGELQLESDASYGKHGRVESFLENGQYYLSEVGRLAASINAPGAHGNSCETADYFNMVYIKPMWKKYWDHVRSVEVSTEEVIESFPFHIYFANAPQPLFPPEATKDSVLEIARGCYRHIEKIFTELEDIRPFEVLRNGRDKANYLLVKEARIIAMTTTHAAIRRQEIANLGFHYDNVIMEEAAQITEIENVIPLALQQPKEDDMPLKRIVLCGDHLQNSPIIQNQAFRQYANLEQSMFLRLVRLGVPTVNLDMQGRARPSLADLYSWRYSKLGNLPIVESSQEFERANAGLRYDYQFVNVPDYKGKGESEPTPHFIQNLGEAEYAVGLFMYLRLLGYPSSSISILTMYAGQRALIKDVLQHRCAKNRLFGLPRIVTTVDKYQGEQNDYIILSLTRTSKIGYLRDIRRLTVALSRARLGLYIFGRREVFEASLELKPVFERLFSRSDKLQVVTGEMFPTTRSVHEEVESTDIDGLEHLGQYVFEITQAKIKSLKEGTEALPPPERGTGLDDGEGLEDEDEEGDDGEQDGYEEDIVEEFDGKPAADSIMDPSA